MDSVPPSSPRPQRRSGMRNESARTPKVAGDGAIRTTSAPWRRLIDCGREWGMRTVVNKLHAKAVMDKALVALREALEPFAKAADDIPDDIPDDAESFDSGALTPRDFRKAKDVFYGTRRTRMNEETGRLFLRSSTGAMSRSPPSRRGRSCEGEGRNDHAAATGDHGDP